MLNPVIHPTMQGEAVLMEYTGAPQVARLLTSARRTGLRLSGLGSDIEPANIDQGYMVQLESIKASVSSVAGYKIGLTNEQAQERSGTSEPIAGHLMTTDILQSPCRLGIDKGHLAVVEAEIVFQMGRDLPPSRAPFSEEEIDASISGVFAGIEICDSRFANPDDLPLPYLVADNGFADRLVIGERLTMWDRNTLNAMSVTLQVGNKPAVRGSTANVLDNPLRSLAWLANWLTARGESLQAGQYVASGSCTGITEASRSDLIVATFSNGASVSLQFSVQSNMGVQQ